MTDKEHAAGQSITSGGMSSVYCKKCGWVNVRSGTAHAEHVCPDFNPPLDYPGIPDDLRRQIREERRELREEYQHALDTQIANAKEVENERNTWRELANNAETDAKYLREALQFYANEENYKPIAGNGLQVGFIHGKIHDYDRGFLARAILAREGGKQ